MRVGIATDHNGVNEKKALIEELKLKGYEMIDYSPNNEPTDDYPDYAYKVSTAVKNSEVDLGILMCGTGIGMSIAANKVKGIRCAKVSSLEEASLAREHNNANVIALSFKLPLNELVAITDKFLSTSFSNDERHVRRVNKITGIEEL